MSDTATASRDEAPPARTFGARAAVTAMTAAAVAIGLSVSPLGFFTVPASIAGADLAPTDPWRLAVPALLVAATVTAALLGTAGRGAVRPDRALVVAWAATVFGAAATAATTIGARLWFGDTRWTSLLTVRVWTHWIAVLAAIAMGIAVGGLIAVLRVSRWPAPVAVAFGVGLVARTGGGWYQPRYDLAAAALAVVALIGVALAATALAADPAAAVPEPRSVRRSVLAWAGPVGVYVALLAVEYDYRTQLFAVYGWNDDYLSTPLFRTAGLVYAVLAVLCAGLVVYLALRGRRFGLTPKAVLIVAAAATALGIGGGGDGWLPGAGTLAVGVVAVAVAAVVPVTWRRIPVLACVELVGIVGLLGGLVRLLHAPGAGGPSYAIWVGSLIVAVTTLRSVRGAGAAPVAALGLLVFSVTPVASMLAGGLLWRAAPTGEVPAAFDRLVWVVLVGAVVPALVAIGFTASRVSDSAD